MTFNRSKGHYEVLSMYLKFLGKSFRVVSDQF